MIKQLYNSFITNTVSQFFSISQINYQHLTSTLIIDLLATKYNNLFNIVNNYSTNYFT